MARNLDVGFTVFADTKPAVAPIRKLRREVAKTDREMVRFGQNLKRRAVAQQQAFRGAVRLTTVAVTALGIALLKAAKISGEYDRSIRLAGILTRTASEDFEEFDKNVKQISSDLAIMPNEVAKAGQAVGRMGFQGADAMDVLRESVTLARASIGQLSAEQSVAAVSTALKAFGLDADQAQRATDAMTTGVTTTALSFDKLPLAFSTASGFAASFGASLEETVAVLGATNDIITKTERASTGVRNIFRDLSQESTKLKLASKGINLEIVDQQGNFRSIVPILGELFKATEKMTEAQRLQVFQSSFSQEAAGALMAVNQRLATGFRNAAGDVVTGIGGLEAFIESLGGTGSTSQLAQAQLKGFAGQMEAFKTEGTLLAEQIGSALNTTLVPALEFVVSVIKDLKEGFEGMGPTTKKIIGVIFFATLIVGAAAAGFIGLSLAAGGYTVVMGFATAANFAFLASLGPIAIVLAVIVGLALLFSKQIKWAFAQLLKFRAAVNEWLGLSDGLDEEEQARIDELEGKTTDPETGERVDKPADPASSVEGIRAAVAAANAPPGSSGVGATAAKPNPFGAGDRPERAFAGQQQAAAGGGASAADINITMEMDAKVVGEALIERQARERRRTFRMV